MSGTHNESGFSVAEVIVAFAILSIALVAIFKAYGLVARGTVASESDRAALAVARSLLATTGVIDRLQPISDSGTLADGTAWSRNISVLASTIAPNLPRPYLVTIEVITPGPKKRQSSASLSTIKLAPPQ